MKRKLHFANSLTASEWILFSRAWLLLLWVELGLRKFSYARVSQWFTPKQPRQSSRESEDPTRQIKRIWQLVDMASRNHILTITCLRRSLVAQRLLNQQGIPVELRFGVKKDSGRIQAHAWLEYQGQVIGDPEQLSQAYEPLARI